MFALPVVFVPTLIVFLTNDSSAISSPVATELNVCSNVSQFVFAVFPLDGGAEFVFETFAIQYG